MRIGDYLREALPEGRKSVSFEFFPPKTPKGEEALFRAIEELRPLEPTYVSVTYGAGGSTRDKTVEIVSRIKNEIGIEAMAHLTCVGSSRSELEGVLGRLRDAGIENVLPLRGDPPTGKEHFERPPDGFGYASELATFIRQQFDFCMAGACYPEKHTDAADLESDLDHLELKVAAGVDFLITQLFFDNARYFSFIEKARGRGIKMPIIPGIMPVTNVEQIERFTAMCGATIPDAYARSLDARRDDPEAVIALGVEYAIAQCSELLKAGAPGVHFYTLNKSSATRRIMQALRKENLL
ncbi:MAG: methylenetetrahydrofolate reductase [NAD(P)H] [Deltaproteobacteria bacterium]|nr:methylenetetrahydrofolate reductase [NAD(P)H] [Deltaproteobacteria bacterium]